MVLSYNHLPFQLETIRPTEFQPWHHHGTPPPPKPQKLPVSEDFKIALAAMTSSEDFETLKNQFFQGN